MSYGSFNSKNSLTPSKDTLFTNQLTLSFRSEMIHAFLSRHSCHCRSSDSCVREREYFRGPVTHGDAFHMAALGIQESAKNLLGFNMMDLGREDAVFKDIRERLDDKISSGEGPWISWPTDKFFEGLKINQQNFKERFLGPEWVCNTEGTKIRKLDENETYGGNVGLSGSSEDTMEDYARNAG